MKIQSYKLLLLPVYAYSYSYLSLCLCLSLPVCLSVCLSVSNTHTHTHTHTHARTHSFSFSISIITGNWNGFWFKSTNGETVSVLIVGVIVSLSERNEEHSFARVCIAEIALVLDCYFGTLALNQTLSQEKEGSLEIIAKTSLSKWGAFSILEHEIMGFILPGYQT